MIRFTCTILLLALLCISKSYAQDGHIHLHERNEVGLSTGALFAVDDSEWGSGIHIHYYRTFSSHSRWSIGGFVEQAWLEGTHFSFGAGVKFSPIDRLSLGVLPGITFTKHNHDEHSLSHSDNDGWNSDFSAHFEVVYDLFHWSKFHLGPVFDYSWSKNDSHFMLGIHAAVCF